MNICEQIEHTAPDAEPATIEFPDTRVVYVSSSRRTHEIPTLLLREGLCGDQTLTVVSCATLQNAPRGVDVLDGNPNLTSERSAIASADVIFIDADCAGRPLLAQAIASQMRRDAVLIVMTMELSLRDLRRAIGPAGYLALLAATPATRFGCGQVLSTSEDLSQVPEAQRFLSTVIRRSGRPLALNAEDSQLLSIAAAISFCGPALVAKYVTHQAKVCHQSENELAQSLQRYCDGLESGKAGESGYFSVGDLWSGLLWWKDEISWVGRTGMFSRDQVVQLAIGALRGYLGMLQAGLSHEEIANLTSEDSGAPPLAQRLTRELVCDGGAPGLRAVISHAACNLGLQS